MHILETPRLLLRPTSPSDELLLHGLHSDPFVVNAIRDGVVPTIDHSKAALHDLIDHWQKYGFGLSMVFVKDEDQTRTFAGYSGLMCRDPFLLEDPNSAELVTCLHLAASGKGIAVEAGRAVVQFAFDHLKLDKVVAFIRPNNKRSILKNMKIGFFYVKDITYGESTRRQFEVSRATAIRADKLIVSNQ
ncbi:GNAT family N-acetyltransferase [Mesorhizobium sp. M0676]|uniref:GNAT family N-acetyltransferase n=1 Tax=Mesorhizobium sp. M0676 TaxID=2956984 RepID=UPI0033375205